MTEIVEEKLKLLPDSPGVYLMKNDQGRIIYVGKAVVLKNRVRQYFQSGKNHTPKVRAMVSHLGIGYLFDGFDTAIENDNEFHARLLGIFQTLTAHTVALVVAVGNVVVDVRIELLQKFVHQCHGGEGQLEAPAAAVSLAHLQASAGQALSGVPHQALPGALRGQGGKGRLQCHDPGGAALFGRPYR